MLVLLALLCCTSSPQTLSDALAGPSDQLSPWLIAALDRDPGTLVGQFADLPEEGQVVVLEVVADTRYGQLAAFGDAAQGNAHTRWIQLTERAHLGATHQIPAAPRGRALLRPWRPTDPAPHQINTAAFPSWLTGAEPITHPPCTERPDVAACYRTQAREASAVGSVVALSRAVGLCRAAPTPDQRRECLFQSAEAHFLPTEPERVSRSYALCFATLSPDHLQAPDPGSDTTFLQGCLYHLRDAFLASPAPWSALAPGLLGATRTLSGFLRQDGVSDRLLATVIDSRVFATTGPLQLDLRLGGLSPEHQRAMMHHRRASIAARLISVEGPDVDLETLSREVLAIEAGAPLEDREVRWSVAPYPATDGASDLPWQIVRPAEASLSRLSWRSGAQDTRAIAADSLDDARISLLEALCRLRGVSADGRGGFGDLDDATASNVQARLHEGLLASAPEVQWTAARSLSWLGLPPPAVLPALSPIARDRLDIAADTRR
ncbi:MAG: hypothetical protein ACI8RZ_003688 [Myxococcota bacterium]|jgi:hypothetical protein